MSFIRQVPNQTTLPLKLRQGIYYSKEKFVTLPLNAQCFGKLTNGNCSVEGLCSLSK